MSKPDTFAELRKAAALLRELEDCEAKITIAGSNTNASVTTRLELIATAAHRCRALEEMPKHAAEAARVRAKLVARAEQAALARVLLAEHPHEVGRHGLPALDRAHELIEQVYRVLGLAVLAGEGGDE
jgi:mannose-1-phosphate guanylyltransferase